MTEIRLDRNTVSRLDFDTAIEAAADRIGDFFPSRAAFDAAKQTDGFAKFLTSQVMRGLDARPTERILVPKWGGASRPASDLSIRIRVLYDALVNLIRSQMPEGIVNWSPVGAARREAERDLVNNASAYVVMTDVANFYEHVSHRILADELLELTAEDQAVEALEQLLAAVQGSESGLPQGPPASGILADIYLSIVDRRLARLGLAFVRFSDDYRIAATSWRSGMRAMQSLEANLREIGLDINPRKSWTPRRALYEEWLAGGPDELDDWVAEHEAPDDEDDAATGPYEWESPDAARKLEKADPKVEKRLSEACAEPAFWGTPRNTEQSRRALAAIRTLGGTTSKLVPQLLSVFLKSFPHLTRDVCIALRQRMRTESEDEALVAVANAVNSELFTYDWQFGWLLHVGVAAGNALPDDIKSAAAQALTNVDLPWFVRGRSAVLLATEGGLVVNDDYGTLFDEAPSASQPDFVLAAAIGQPSESVNFLRAVSSDPIFRGITDLAAPGNEFRW